MTYEISICLNRAYFQEVYEQIVSSNKQWLILEIVFGVLLVLGGATYAMLLDTGDITPYAIILFGIFETASPALKKRRWLRRQLSNKSAGKTLSLEVNEDGYTLSGAYGSTEQLWKGVDSYERTSRGIIIRPQKGAVIYVSEDSEGSEVVDFIEHNLAN